MEANIAQTLIVLGEERVARRMAEDRVESLTTQLEAAKAQLELKQAECEALTTRIEGGENDG